MKSQQPWTKAEVKLLRTLSNLTAGEAGKRLGRTTRAVGAKRRKLGIRAAGCIYSDKYSDEEVAYLVANSHRDRAELASTLGRSINGVQAKMAKLGLRFHVALKREANAAATRHGRWTPDEIDRVTTGDLSNLGATTVAIALSRTYKSVRSKLYKIRNIAAHQRDQLHGQLWRHSTEGKEYHRKYRKENDEKLRKQSFDYKRDCELTSLHNQLAEKIKNVEDN